MKLISLWFLLVMIASFSLSITEEEFEENVNETPFIIGGSTALDGEFPFVVAAILYNGHDTFNCGGSIIAHRWILTAGHCAFLHSNAIDAGFNASYILAGTNNRIDGGVLYNISKAYPHPNFDFISKTDDIGLLELAQSIVYDNKTQPIQIAQKSPPENSTAFFAGWGFIDNHQTQPILLHKITLNTINVHKCRELYPIHENEHPICTLMPKGKGLCNYDSGGPLIYNKSVVGVHSVGGSQCAFGVPDVFSNPIFYQKWIHSITENL